MKGSVPLKSITFLRGHFCQVPFGGGDSERADPINVAEVGRTDMGQIPVHPRQFFGRVYGQLKSELKDETELYQFVMVGPAAKRVRISSVAIGEHQWRFFAQGAELLIEIFSLWRSLDHTFDANTRSTHLHLQVVPIDNGMADSAPNAAAV